MTTLTKKKSLREFSFTTKSIKGDSLKVFLSYDMTAGNGGFSVGVSVNGAPVSYTKRDLRRLSALKSPELDSIMSATSMDSSGCEKDLYETTMRLLNEFVVDGSNSAYEQLRSMFSISNEEQDRSLTSMINKYNTKVESGKATKKSLESIVTRYCDTQRLRLLENARQAVQLIRGLYRNGIEINGTNSPLEFEGWLKENDYPSYYKRDIDYIRKSRERICWYVLETAYTPVK